MDKVLGELNRIIDMEWANLEDWGEEYLFTAQSILRYRDALASAQERIEELEKAGTHALGTLKGIYQDKFVPDEEKVVKTFLVQSISKLEHTLTPVAAHQGEK